MTTAQKWLLAAVGLLAGGLGALVALTPNQGRPQARTLYWSKLAPAHAPARRTWATASYDSARQRTVVFGGMNTVGAPLADTWEWNATDWNQRSPATSPSARFMTHTAFDGADVLLFGGNVGGWTPDAQTWKYNGTTWRQITPAHSPPPTYGGALTWDTTRGVGVLYGGVVVTAGSSYPTCTLPNCYATNATWEWNGTDWNHITTATDPGARQDHAMVYDSARRVHVVFGGDNRTTVYATALEYNGTDWRTVTTANSPLARYYPAAVYDAALARTRVVMGVTKTPWEIFPASPYTITEAEYDGNDWRSVLAYTYPSTAASAALGPVAVYDSTRRQTVLLTGGWGAACETWVLASTVTDPIYTTTVYAGDAGAQTDAWAMSGCTGDGGTAQEIFAAPAGHVSAAGACTCGAPCTLEAARDVAQTRLAGATGNTTVWLHGGDYRRTAPLTLDASHSGQNGHRLRVVAAPGETPVLNGAVRLTEWHHDQDHVWAQPDVYWARYPGPTPITPRQLWVNGRRAPRAQSTVTGITTTKFVSDAGVTQGFLQSHTGNAAAEIADWPDRADIEVVGHNDWIHYRCPVSRWDRDRVWLGDPCWRSSQWFSLMPFNGIDHLEGSRALLTSPGQWHFDPQSRRVYYYLRADETITTLDAEVPVTESLLTVTGTATAPVSAIDVAGITFAHATWSAPSTTAGYVGMQAGMHFTATPTALVNNGIGMYTPPLVLASPPGAVTALGAHDVRFDSCTFHRLGGAGLVLQTAPQHVVVDRSRFDDISSAAIILGGVMEITDHHPADAAHTASDNTISNNYITRAGAEYSDAAGIFVGFTTRTTITQNDLFDLPYTGISVGWGWGWLDVGGVLGYVTPTSATAVTVTNNRVGYALRSMADGGGLYFLSAQSGSVVSGNVVYELAGSAGCLLYLDDYASGFTGGGNALFSNHTAPGAGAWALVKVASPGNNTDANFVTTDGYTTCTAPTCTNTQAITYANFSAAAAVIAAAGSPLHDPEVGRNCTASSSSVYSGTYAAAYGCDGRDYNLWAPTTADTLSWWQADLGATYCVSAVEVVSRWDLDIPAERSNYRVRASVHSDMSSATTLGTVGATPLAFQEILQLTPAACVTARYVRMEKTSAGGLTLGEMLIHGH